MNLFLTEDGVLKLGYYGLITQAECYSIKKTHLVCLATAKYSFVYFSKHYFGQMVKYVGFLSLVTVFELCILTTASYPGPIAAAQ